MEHGVERTMHHPDIEAWLASRGEDARLRALERKAAEVWFDTLSLEQREVFAELIAGHEGMYHLRNRVVKARIEGERKRNEEC
jgi:hypothetical protein